MGSVVRRAVGFAVDRLEMYALFQGRLLLWRWRRGCRRCGSSTSELPLEDGGLPGPEAVESYPLS